VTRLLQAWAAVVAAVAASVLAGGSSAAADPAAEPAVPASRLVGALSASVVDHGAPVVATGRLTGEADGVPVAGAEVVLLSRPSGSAQAWTSVGSAVTDALGEARIVDLPTRHSDYLLRHDGSAAAGPSESAVLGVQVRTALLARLPAASVRAGRPAVVSGTVAPVVAGSLVHLQLQRSGGWHTVASARPDPAGAFTFPVRPPTPGWWTYRVTADGDDQRLPARSAPLRLDAYLLHTYVVRRRGAVIVPTAQFAAAVAAVYADPRGWLRAHHRFRRVPTGGQLTVVLAQARYLPTYSRVCSAVYSCRVGRNVVINQDRWRRGSRHFPGGLAEYRQMLVNHETGHWLGAGHARCPARGAPAPVMQQQSKGMQGCRPNPWPLPRDLRAAR
jgi:hypothetical protein